MIKKIIISYILVIIILIALGTNREHGDENAGSMFAVVGMLPVLILIPLCNLMAYWYDKWTFKSKWNLLKDGVHLSILFALFWISPKEILFGVIIVCVGVVLFVNLIERIYLLLYIKNLL